MAVSQSSFDDLGVHLSKVDFCVLDLETTGGSPASCAITEIGAVRYRGGDLTGTFHTLVNPGAPIPAFITVLTGITQSMVIEAPRIEEALPSLLEFIGEAVVVGHNVRFDLSFLNAACERLGYSRISNPATDTAALARRLCRNEVRNLQLSSLSAHFRSPVTPIHRALDDARATAHVFWALLERAGTLGVTHLGDLLALRRARGSPFYSKLALTQGLPALPGVYLFRDRTGAILYVGKAKNLRSRVRSYFYGDDRRNTISLLRELAVIEHRVCTTELEAAVAELRLISGHSPRYNRRSKGGTAYWVKLTNEAFPRLSLVRALRPDGNLQLGPFRGRQAATTVVESLWDAVPIRRCRGQAKRRSARCGYAQLGVAVCPCDGSLSQSEYQPVIERLRVGIDQDPALLFEPLAQRMATLAREKRFEEAGWVRDRMQALARAITRRNQWKALQAAGLLRLETAAGEGALADRGRLVATWGEGEDPPLLPLDAPSAATSEVPPTLADAEEALLIWNWLTRSGAEVLESSEAFALPRHRADLPKSIAV